MEQYSKTFQKLRFENLMSMIPTIANDWVRVFTKETSDNKHHTYEVHFLHDPELEAKISRIRDTVCSKIKIKKSFSPFSYKNYFKRSEENK